MIGDLRAEAMSLNLKNFKICVVDDSTDETKKIAAECGAEVVSGPGTGLGGAYLSGTRFCLGFQPDVVVTLDGDGQVALSELKLFLTPLMNGYDLVVGSRFLHDNKITYSYPTINHLGSKMLSGYLTAMTGQKLTDSHGGFRAMKADVLKNLHLKGTHTYVQETLIEASEAGFKILEIPSQWLVRKHGGSRVVGSIPKYIKRVGPVLLKRLARKIFFGKSR